jgi:hypothetical protein
MQVHEGTNPMGWNAVGETYVVVIDPAEEGEVRSVQFVLRSTGF